MGSKWAPDPVINVVITPISRIITPMNTNFFPRPLKMGPRETAPFITVDLGQILLDKYLSFNGD